MNIAGWRAAWRMAWREARSSAPKFAFVVLGVAAGVGALTGVRGFATGFQDLLKREARTLMAGDMLIRLFNALTPAQEAELEKWQSKGVKITPILETVSMISASKDRPPLLTSLKAVDTSAYPFYGSIKLEPPQRLRDALQPDAIAVSDDLLMRLGVNVGDRVKVGQTEMRIVAVVKFEPDRMTGSLNVGPRAMMSRQALETTGLMQVGSRAARRFLFKLPAEGVPVSAVRNSLKTAFPDGLISDYRETHPIITRTLDRSTTFLSLVSLIALIVGALGVATAVHSHIQQRLDTIAILKCLGARSSQIIRIYALQTTMLGIAGGVAGIAVGGLVQQLFPLLLAKYFQFSGLLWSPAFALEGLLTGVLVSLLFTLPPLLSIRDVKPALIFRREMAEVQPPWRVRLRRLLPALVSGLLILGGLGLVAAWLADSARIGWTFIGGLVTSLAILSLAAWLLLKGLKRFVERGPFRLPVAWRHGLANLYRPGNHAASILVSLGIGVMFTLTIHLIQNGFLKEVAGAAPPGAPNVFLINITDNEKEGVRQILEAQQGRTGKIRIEPFTSARLLRIGSRDPASWNLKGFEGRRYLRTREVTYQGAQPEEVEVRKGAWWAQDEKRPVVAVSDHFAEAFSVSPGTQLRWTILGREFDVTIVAVYRLKQVRMSPVSDFVFNPIALAGVPTQWVATGRWKAEQVPALQMALYKKYPTVTAVNAADILNLVQEVIDQVALLVRFISLFAIAAGAIILAATVAGTRLRRVRESAVLKTIGARRRHLTGIFSVEFSVLGGVAGLDRRRAGDRVHAHLADSIPGLEIRTQSVAGGGDDRPDRTAGHGDRMAGEPEDTGSTAAGGIERRMILLLAAALPLAVQFESIASSIDGRVGIAAMLVSTGELASVRGAEKFPMQSVYKMPIGAVALKHLDMKRQVVVTPADYVSERQHSPIRDKHPRGVTLPVSELLRLMVSESDGSACDVTLRLLGGPAAVQRRLPVPGIEVRNTEKELGSTPDVQYENSSTPTAMVQYLRLIARERPAPLLKWMTETETGPKRIKGLLPAGTVVAHKTGSSRTVNGKTAATNDVGLVTLPDGSQFAIAVFVSDTTAPTEARDAVIAQAARAAWDYWVSTGKFGSRP